MKSIYTYSLLISSLISLPLYDLYWDILLTKYYLVALHENKIISICSKTSPDYPDQIEISDEGSLLQTIVLPPFFHFSAKSLSQYPTCFVLHAHHEGFLPGSLTLSGPLYQIKWTLSYSGRLSYICNFNKL